jgi:hypothetical protein
MKKYISIGLVGLIVFGVHTVFAQVQSSVNTDVRYQINNPDVVLPATQLRIVPQTSGDATTAASTSTSGTDENATTSDIEDQTQGVMQSASQGAYDDLNTTLGDMQDVNKKKDALRGAENEIKGEMDAHTATSEGEGSSSKMVSGGLHIDVSEDSLAGDSGKVFTKITDVSKVKTSDDLENFTKTIIANDPNITDASVSDTGASLKYKTKAKLFGFIPASLTATAAVDANGKATVSYPWYGFLFGYKSIDTGAALSDLQGAINADVQTTQDTKDSIGDMSQMDQLQLQMIMDKKAKLIEALSNIMKKAAETQDNITGNLK